MEDDSDIAFKLQLEEALAASLHDGAASPPAAADSPYDAVLGSALEYDQELLDQYLAEAVAEQLRLDLRRQIHDRAFACEISSIPEEEWTKIGDNLSRPYGEGSSASAAAENGEGLGFRVHVKGLVEGVMGGVGVAICDGNDGLVFELYKCLSGKEKDEQMNGELVELKALIEGLDTSLMLDVKRITIVTDNPWLYQYVTGENPQTTANVATLAGQMNLLLRKFSHTHASHVASNDIRYAIELARKAIAFQVNRSVGNSNANNLTVCCTICLEDTYVDQMFLITSCEHSYCFSCMSKHVQFKLLQGKLPKCPYENCQSELKLDSCKKFLSPELLGIMSQRVKEASIPATEKIYCPHPRCSTLLSKTELQGSVNHSFEVLGCRLCPKCRGLFCINCKVRWHNNMNCSDFKRQNPSPSNEDQILKNLATRNLWRQCPKCNHMVSLASGCYHIYCRCGHEFCYTCGAEWRNKKATCSCPIWDERNLLYEEQNRRQGR